MSNEVFKPLCFICKQNVIDVVHLSGCTHVFCNNCIEIENSKQCVFDYMNPYKIYKTFCPLCCAYYGRVYNERTKTIVYMHLIDNALIENNNPVKEAIKALLLAYRSSNGLPFSAEYYSVFKEQKDKFKYAVAYTPVSVLDKYHLFLNSNRSDQIHQQLMTEDVHSLVSVLYKKLEIEKIKTELTHQMNYCESAAPSYNTHLFKIVHMNHMMNCIGKETQGMNITDQSLLVLIEIDQARLYHKPANPSESMVSTLVSVGNYINHLSSKLAPTVTTVIKTLIINEFWKITADINKSVSISQVDMVNQSNEFHFTFLKKQYIRYHIHPESKKNFNLFQKLLVPFLGEYIAPLFLFKVYFFIEYMDQIKMMDILECSETDLQIELSSVQPRPSSSSNAVATPQQQKTNNKTPPNIKKRYLEEKKKNSDQRILEKKPKNT